MVIWWNCLMVNRLFADTFPSMVKLWRGKIQFARWSEFCPPGRCTGGELFLDRILSCWEIILGGMSHGNFLGVFFPQENTKQHLTHYWGVICPRICLGIIWYFYTYDGTDFISSYAKVCVHYGMFLYIRLQYVPGFCPNISRGTLSLWKTRFWSSFIFRNVR